MRIGYRCLFTGIIAAALAGPAAAQAQVPDEAPLGQKPPAAPAAPTTGAIRPGQQAAFQKPAPIVPGRPMTVLVFPFTLQRDASAPVAPETAPPGAPANDPSAITGAPHLSDDEQAAVDSVTAAVKAGFLATPAYTVYSYFPTAALVRRAKDANVITAEMQNSLYSAGTGELVPQSAQNIAYHLGMQSFLVGNVEIASDAADNSVEVTLDCQLVDSTTGKPIRTAAVTGSAAGAAGVSQVTLREAAAQVAARKAYDAMGIQLIPRPVPEPKGKRGKGKGKGSSDTGTRKSAPETPGVLPPAGTDIPNSAVPGTGNAPNPQPAPKSSPGAPGASAGSASPAAVEASAPAPAVPAVEERSEATTGGEKAANRASGRNGSRKGAVVAQAPPAPAPGTVVAPPAPSDNAAPAAPTVKGVADPSGNPDPYGYAVGKDTGRRSRTNLKVPAWLGVAAFLTGVSFLL